jgi:transmembrane sensor
MYHSYFEHLIVKRLSDSLTEREQQELDHWLGASEANREIEQEYTSIWNNANRSSLPTMQPFDLDAAFAETMQKAQAPAEVKLAFWQKPVFKVAAAIALLVIGTLAYVGRVNTDNTLIAYGAADKISLIKLPDGSQVWLDHNAELRYPAKFAGNTRPIQLTGKAFFEVVPNQQQAFVVTNSLGASVKVLGTSFSVDDRTHKTTQVMVKTGKVEVTTASNNKHEVLNPGQMATLENDQIILGKINNQSAFDWRSNELIFEEEKLSKVVELLEDRFGVQIEIQNKESLQCEYTARISGKSLEQILDLLCKTFQFRIVRTQPNNYVLNGGGC